MAYLLIQHEVEEYDAWKPYFDDHDGTREEHGQQGYQLFRAEDDPNEVTALLEFDTMANAREFAGLSELRELMTEAGVEGEPTLSFLEQVETKQDTRQSA